MAPAMMSAQVRPMTIGARSMVSLEDELVALLEQDAEGGGRDQLQERQASAPQRRQRGTDEEDRGGRLDQDVERVHGTDDTRPGPAGRRMPP